MSLDNKEGLESPISVSVCLLFEFVIIFLRLSPEGPERTVHGARIFPRRSRREPCGHSLIFTQICF